MSLFSKKDDAIDLLKEDHKEVDQMFDAFEDCKDAGDTTGKARISGKICDALTIHAMVEEEIFYPAVEVGVPEASEMLAEAKVEHEGLKRLIADIEQANPSSQEYDADVKVLGEQVKHHVKEEERDLFPKVKKSDLDLEALGDRIAARKRELGASPTAFKRKRDTRPIIDIGAPGPNG